MQAEREEPTDLLMAGDVARILGVSRSRVRQLTLEGKLQCVRLPRGIRLYSRCHVYQVRDRRNTAAAKRHRGGRAAKRPE